MSTIIQVEFYGIPRQRAGTPALQLEFDKATLRLSTVIAELARRLPELAAACFSGNGLQDGCVANVNGQKFVRDENVTLVAGDSLLLLSADAGG